MKTATKTPLNCDAITAEPVTFPFEPETHEDFAQDGRGSWKHYPPYAALDSLKDAKQAYDNLGRDWPDDLSDGYEMTDEDYDRIREHLQENDQEAGYPQMNYFYPLPGLGDDEAAALALKLHLYGPCLCVVRVGDENGLALTGGGMDLSWEICEAHIMAGYLPPIHFGARLPRMSDRGTSRKDRQTIARCRESLRTAAGWARNGLRYLRESFPA